MLRAACDANNFTAAYALLVGQDIDPLDNPAPWEFLMRRARAAGEKAFCGRVAQHLWSKGVVSTALAIDLAQVPSTPDPEAVAILRRALGHTPPDPEARLLLAERLVGTDPDEATRLLQDFSFERPETRLRAIEVLRRADALDHAELHAVSAMQYAPDDTRFTVRLARIRESQGRWAEALDLWQDLAGALDRAADGTLMKIAHLAGRLERRDLGLAAAGRMLGRGSTLIERLRYAEVAGLDDLAAEILRAELKSTVPGDLAGTEWHDVLDLMMDQGNLGMVLWLKAMGLPLPDDIRRRMDGLADHLGAEPPPMTGLAEARAFLSPEVLLPSPWPRTGLIDSAMGAGSQLAIAHRGSPQERILIVNSTLSSGGAERQLVTLVRSLIEAGIDRKHLHVAIYSLAAHRGHGHFLQAMQDLGVGLHELSRTHPSSLQPSERLSRFLDLLPRRISDDLVALLPLIERLRPSVLHGWQDRSGMACALAGSLTGIGRVVFSARNMRPERRNGLGERGLHAVLDAVVAEDRFTLTANAARAARDYETWLGLAEGRISVLTNGFDLSALPLLPRPQTDHLTVLGVFRLAANKRPLLWLRTVAALGNLLDRPVRARIVGGGPFETELEDLAAELGVALERQTRLHAFADIYGGADLLLLMSRVEGLPNVLIEAQAAGLPVAACDVGGVAEALWQGPGGGLLLAEDVTPEDAAARLAGWLPEALAALPEARRDFIGRNFDLGVLGQRCLALYQSAGAPAPALDDAFE